MESRKRLKNDILLIAALLVLAGAALLCIRLTRTGGGTVKVTVDGKVVAQLPLGQDCTRVIDTGRGSNTLVISDGGASVTQADCPDKVCVAQGTIRYDGETIVCLPHRLVVTISGASSGAELDATADRGVTP